MKNQSIYHYLLLIPAILLPLFIGFIGSYFTISQVTGWFVTLNKPWFSPPNWVFAPAWTILYILMGLSWWFVLKSGFEKPSVRRATFWFLIQLAVNLLWSIVFFGMESPAGALGVIFLLLFLILVNMHYFRFVSRCSVYLLIPYLCWTSFATLLNAMIVILNL
ncbi:MAG: tryptophan-rich sensory protein [Methanomicrobiales archaeon]|nr:tryptophan-rich sensory protein [Methanomicrobiales archaeon]